MRLSGRSLWCCGVVALVLGSMAPYVDAGDLRISRRSGAVVDGMVFIPSGWFIMGSDTDTPGERPRRRVFLDAYYMDQFEVTNAAYARCVEAGVCRAAQVFDKMDAPELPVVGVGWSDAVTYCKWVGKVLPTEAQWEKAARGDDARRFPWGDGALGCDKMNFGHGYNDECPSNPGRAAVGGSYAADVSPYGVWDMGGNVWEYVLDNYSEDFGPKASATNPTGPPGPNGRHTIKGGSWFTTADNIRLSWRTWRDESRYEYDGFRCARPGAGR